MKKVSLVAAVAALAVGLGWTAPLVPGDQTDPTASAGRPTATSRGHEPDEPYRYPYISTYYVEPTVKAGEAEALGNVKGLNQLMADLSAAGYRKLVLLPGTYRLSATAFLTLPDNFTLDLNGAVLKENGFTGDHAAMVKFESTYDAHLVNGVVEGDYFEHDYEHSPNDSEWPMGIELGAGKNPHVDWEFGMRGVEFGPDKRPPAKIMVDKTGRLSGCTFTKTDVSYPMLSSCKMLGCNCALPAEGEWSGCKMKTCTFSGATTLVLSDCKIAKSTFRYIVGGKLIFRRCTLDGVTFADVDADRVVFEDCTFNGTNPPNK